MTEQSPLCGPQSNIVPIAGLPKLLDPLFLDAHRLIDLIPRQKLIDLIPLLQRAADGGPAGAGTSNPIGESSQPAVARMEPSASGRIPASG